MHLICDKLANARAMATTIELALATIGEDCTPQDAADVRSVALMLTKRLRKLEGQINTHHDLSKQGAPHP
jgi:hypothetical protein